jgi:hypothetical protein
VGVACAVGAGWQLSFQAAVACLAPSGRPRRSTPQLLGAGRQSKCSHTSACVLRVLPVLCPACAKNQQVQVAAQQALDVLMSSMPPGQCADILSHKLPSEAASASGTAVDGETLCATIRCLQVWMCGFGGGGPGAVARGGSLTEPSGPAVAPGSSLGQPTNTLCLPRVLPLPPPPHTHCRLWRAA